MPADDLTLAPGASLTATAAGTVLHDDAAAVLLPRGVEDLAAASEATLRELQRRGLVVERSAAPDALAATLARWPAAPPDAAQRVRGARVALAGDPALAGLVGDELASLGCGIGEPVEGATLVLCATAARQLALVRTSARAAQAAGVPWLGGRLDGSVALIGPLALPGRSACAECARVRLLAAGTAPLEQHALHEALLAADPPPAAGHPATAGRLLASLLALEALKLLAGLDEPLLAGRVLQQSLVTLEAGAHRVLQLPWCPVCGGPAAADGEDGPGDVLAALEGWIGGAAGPIRSVALEAEAPDLPPRAGALLAPRYDGVRPPRVLSGAGGKGATPEEALAAAAGEAVETYAAACVPWAALRLASVSLLGREAIDPAALGHPAADPARTLPWARVAWADDGSPAWAPAALVYGAAADEDGGWQATSSGLAAGGSWEDAARRATLELVERDAILVAWLARRAGRPLAEDGSLDAAAAGTLAALRARGAVVSLALLRAAGGLPVVLCLGLGDGRSWPAGVVSCAADPDPRRAARAAVLEQSAVGVELLRQSGVADSGTPLAHGLRYARPEAVAELRWLAGEGVALALGAVDAAPPGLAGCIAALGADGVRVALADVTPPDLRRTGLRVARALAPGLVPLWFGDEPLGLDLPRVRQALAGREPNRAPHPLA